MPDLIYDHQFANRDLGAWLHPLLRRPPTYVGAPDRVPAELRGPHVLPVAVLLAGERFPTRIDLSDLRDISTRLGHISVLQGLDFYSQWILLHGPIAAFDNAGIWVLDRQAPPTGRPALVAGPGRLPVRFRSTGDRSHGPATVVALAALGAQLYLCEKTGLGVEGPGGSALTATVAERLSSLLDPLRSRLHGDTDSESLEEREDWRSREGETGHGDTLYRNLLQRGTPLVRQRFPGKTSKAAIGEQLKGIGGALPLPHAGTLPFAQKKAEEQVSAAVDWACLTLRRDEELRKIRPGLGEDPADPRGLFLVNVPAAETLVEASAVGTRPPDLFALTRLAHLWDVTPADDYQSLFPWRLHFAAARFLGRLHRGGSGEVDLDAEAHWGLRAIRYDVLDGSLDDQTREARAWLRRYMTFDDDFWALEPKLLHDMPVRPAWRFLSVRKAKGGAP